MDPVSTIAFSLHVPMEIGTISCRGLEEEPGGVTEISEVDSLSTEVAAFQVFLISQVT